MHTIESTNHIFIDFVRFEYNALIIEGGFCYDSSGTKPELSIDGGYNCIKKLELWKDCGSNSKKTIYRFKTHLEFNNTKNKSMSFYFYNNECEKCTIEKYNRYCSISDVYSNAYYHNENWYVMICDDEFIVKPYTNSTGLALEAKLSFELVKRGHAISAMMRMFAKIYKRFGKRKIWLLYDRIEHAGDNAESTFIYLQKNPPDNVKTVFLISRKSKDYKRISKLGTVVCFFSGIDRLLFLLCECKISSHALPYFTNPFGEKLDIFRDIVADTRFIFLQHGVLKDDLSSWLNRYNRNIFGFIASTHFEYNLINKGKYMYLSEKIWLTGMPRYDRLYNSPKKQIYIMPTWRKYLMEEKYDIIGNRQLENNYFTSSFFANYTALINNIELHKILQKFGYTLHYVPHPMFKNYPEHMQCGGNVAYDDTTSYVDIFARASLLITDYSSVAFDFAYLQKPVIYWHFDADEFYSGKHTFSKSPYNYETMGFGDVVKTLEDIVDKTIHYVKTGCQMDEVYRQRVIAEFAHHDTNNCERVVKRIIYSYLLFVSFIMPLIIKLNI